MITDKIMQSKIYRFLDYVFRLVILNLLIVVPSFSFFIIGSFLIKDQNSSYVYLTYIPMLLWLFPSLVATFDVIKQYETNETNTIFKDFFKSFKRNYLNSILLTIIISVLVFLIYNSLSFFYIYTSRGTIYLLGLALSFSFAVALLMIIFQLPIVMAYFKGLRLIEIIKLASIMAFKDILSSVIIVILFAVMIALSVAIYIVMAIVGLSLPCYFAIKLSYQTYIKIYRKVEKND